MAKLHDRVRGWRAERLEAGDPVVTENPQGVSKDRIRAVLAKLNITNVTLIDVVYALLDDEEDNWYSSRSTPSNAKFNQGASTAMIFCHVGVLQQNKDKLDREGRDDFIKPLHDLGAIEFCYLDSSRQQFLHGHPKAKSPNNAYRLHEGFVQILRANDDEWQPMLELWTSEDSVRERKAFQAEMAERTRQRIDTAHEDLIRSAVNNYVARFLPGFVTLYVDASDGDRVTEDEGMALRAAGLSLDLGDAMPDVLLWNEKTDALWVIEAVTSDGEVDLRKQRSLSEFAERHGKNSIGFTTAYQRWKDFASRQKKMRLNLAPGTFVWVEEAPDVHLLVDASPVVHQK